MHLITTILDSLPNGVIAIDCDERVIVFNDAAARLMGVLKEEVLGAEVLTVIPNSGLVNVLRTGLPEEGRQQFIGQRAVLAFQAPIIHDDRMIGAVSIFQDITEFEKVSRELDSTKTLVRSQSRSPAGQSERFDRPAAGGNRDRQGTIRPCHSRRGAAPQRPIHQIELRGRYDNFSILPELEDVYSSMVKYVVSEFYESTTRYTTSAFLRMKLGDALKKRDLAPHIYETREEAKLILDKLGEK